MKHKLFPVPVLAAALAVVLLAAGCAHFDREWKQAAGQPARDLSGRWEGRWISTSNGHSGALRAVIAPTGPHKFRASFHATYAGVLNFTYPVTFETTQHGSRVDFCGAAELPGWAGGRYTSSGHATRTTFTASYQSKYDEGRFEMKRVTDQPAAAR